MLILTRRIGERIVISDGQYQIVLTILGIRMNQIKIGIEAPKDIAVHREEIYHRIVEGKLKKDSKGIPEFEE